MKKRIISFSWQHLLLIVSLSIMTCGVALCIRPNFSSSVIATIPFIIALAEEASIVSLFTIVEYTHIMNFHRASDSHPPPEVPTDTTFPIHYWFCIRFPIRC